MDDYYDESVALPEVEVSAKRIQQKTLAKAGIGKRSRSRVRLGLLAAAAAVLLMGTVGAVGYTMWDAARNDAGIPADAEVPEFVEYSQEGAALSFAETKNQSEIPVVEGAEVTLVSTLCSGSDVTAYLAISPVTQEMADAGWEENEGLYTFASWETGGVFEAEGVDALDGYSAGGTQIEYDAETQTALVRLDYYGDVFGKATAITTGIVWYHEDGGDVGETKYYGTVTIPITPSETVVFQLDAEVENDYLRGETAALTEVSVGANNLELIYEVKLFQEFCDEYGDNGWFVIGDAYWGYYDELNGKQRRTEYTELDAQTAYGRSWRASMTRLLETAYLTLTDGGEISLSGLQETDSYDSPETQIWNARFELPSAVSLSQVESLTIGGQTYTVK